MGSEHKKFGDLTGQKFGKWTVLRMVTRTSTDGHRRTACLCRCECGTERVIYAQSLRSGQSKSCGCAKPVPSAGRRPKAEKSVACSELVELAAPVGDDWMFGQKGGKGLFVTRRAANG